MISSLMKQFSTLPNLCYHIDLWNTTSMQIVHHRCDCTCTISHDPYAGSEN